MFGGRRVVIFGKNFTIWQPEMTSRIDQNISSLVVFNHGPIVDTKMIPAMNEKIMITLL